MENEIILAILGSTVVNSIVNIIYNIYHERKSANTKVETALNLLLLQELKRLCDKYISENSITDDELEEVIEIYKCYKSLKGNGFVDKIYNDVLKIPVKF